LNACRLFPAADSGGAADAMIILTVLICESAANPLYFEYLPPVSRGEQQRSSGRSDYFDCSNPLISGQSILL